mgnify:CR=1 FL=1
MPSSGKTTVGKALAEKLQREFFDSDLLVAETENMTIPDIFKNKGEAYFRTCETEAIFTLSKNNSSVIATGGGAVLNKKNIELLKEGEPKSITGKKALTETATRLQKTLYSFGVSAKVENVSVGPAITRYELKPAEGVRVSKIANLADDIALSLAAETIRIEENNHFPEFFICGIFLRKGSCFGESTFDFFRQVGILKNRYGTFLARR